MFYYDDNFLKFYKKVSNIGTGSTGNVSIYTQRNNKSVKAVKHYKTDYYPCVGEYIINELNVLQKLNHINIISINSVFIDQNKSKLNEQRMLIKNRSLKSNENIVIDNLYNIYVVMPYYHLNLLSFKFMLNKYPEKNKICNILMYQLLNAINYMNVNGYVHRDIKPENIMITFTNKSYEDINLVLIDFGLAKYLPVNVKPDTCAQTINYRSPEMLLKLKETTYSIDIWSVGCIFYEVLTTHLLFWDMHDKKINILNNVFKLVELINIHEWPTVTKTKQKYLQFCYNDKSKEQIEYKLLNANNNFNKTFKDLNEFELNFVKHCLQVNPHKRYNAKQLLNLPYFASFNKKINLAKDYSNYYLKKNNKILLNSEINNKTTILFNKDTLLTKDFYFRKINVFLNHFNTVNINILTNAFYIYYKCLTNIDYDQNQSNMVLNTCDKLIEICIYLCKKKHTNIIDSTFNLNLFNELNVLFVLDYKIDCNAALFLLLNIYNLHKHIFKNEINLNPKLKFLLKTIMFVFTVDFSIFNYNNSTLVYTAIYICKKLYDPVLFNNSFDDLLSFDNFCKSTEIIKELGPVSNLSDCISCFKYSLTKMYNLLVKKKEFDVESVTKFASLSDYELFLNSENNIKLKGLFLFYIFIFRLQSTF